MDYQFYAATDYILAPFILEDLPAPIAKVIEFLNPEYDYCIRGGAAYLLLTGRSEVLTDLDILAPLKQRDYLIESIAWLAQEAFLNKNTSNQDVLTLFWSAGCDYYKIDILFSDSLPDTEQRTLHIAGKKFSVPVVTGPWLWATKLQKVGRLQSGKTLSPKSCRHAQVVVDLGEWLLKSKNVIFPKCFSQSQLIVWKKQAKQGVGSGTDGFDHRHFNEIVDKVIAKSVRAVL